MTQLRVLIVVGTRPEAIKMAPVITALECRDELVETRLALTGQHTTLVEQVLQVFDIRPDYDLDIMKEGQNLYDVVHQALEGLRGVVQDFQPDLLLVQGDTATVFVGSLVGFFEKIKVGHVEAGLRTNDKWAPWPEEMFRRMTDVVADYHFAPTHQARKALLEENVSGSNIHVTGNTVVDALLHISERKTQVENETLRKVIEGGRRLVLLTAHRRESFGTPLVDIFSAVRSLADEHPDIEIVYPVHPNPNVLIPAKESLSNHPRIHLTEPLNYVDLTRAIEVADLILTDSGGIQEEAPTFGTPVLILRDVTERTEGVEAGTASLVGTDPSRILVEGRRCLVDRTRSDERPPNPYGDGRAGTRIADILLANFLGCPRQTEDWVG